VFDGVRTHHFRPEESPTGAADLAALIEQLAREPHTPERLRALHDAAAAESPLSVADDLVKLLRGRGLTHGQLHDIGAWLAEHGTSRGPVALGIILLGIGGDRRDRETLLLLGALDDVTLYAAVALKNSQPDPERALFELARRVDNWGRIHAVERLAGTTDPEIKAWLLRDGFRNGIMDEYVAYTAATTGDLLGALRADAIDAALLDGAGGILCALLVGGPAQDIEDYADAPAVIDRYLIHAGQAPPDLTRIALVARLRRYSTVAGALIDRPEWQQAVHDGLESDDRDVLEAWDLIPAETLAAVERARHAEVDDQVRDRIDALLATWVSRRR
jgi:hypothetical protein